MISFVVPAYNVEAYIGDCLGSIFQQLPPDGEVVVIDDASTDETAAAVERIRDGRLKFVRLSHNVGAAEAKNIGILLSRHEFISFLDGDDMAAQGRVDKTLAVFHEKEECLMVYGGRVDIDTNGKPLDDMPRVPPPFDLESLFYRNYITWSSTTIRREAVRRFGLLVPSLRSWSDWEYWLRLGIHTIPQRTEEVLCMYRRNPQDVTSRDPKWRRPHQRLVYRRMLAYARQSNLPLPAKLRICFRCLRKLTGISHHLALARKALFLPQDEKSSR